jgi:hypothetical protein
MYCCVQRVPILSRKLRGKVRCIGVLDGGVRFFGMNAGPMGRRRKAQAIS